jgi:hypothetical protein
MVRVPAVALLLAVTVIVDDPDFESEEGLKDTVMPLPCPEAVKLIAEPRVPLTVAVIVELVLPLGATLIDVGDALSVNVAATGDTVRFTVVVLTRLPEVPVTVIG